MSALKPKKFTKARKRVATGRSLGMSECGRVTRRTKGTTQLLFFENGTPPFNWLYTS